MRLFAASLLMAFLSVVPARGQESSVVNPTARPQLAMPVWLAPFSQAKDQSASATDREGESRYTALAPAAEVVAYYQREMRTAGVTFESNSDGIGVSISASTGKISAVVRVREEDGVTNVKVSYALKPEPAPAQVTAAAPAGPSGPELPAGPARPAASKRRAATSPWTHAPYTWAMQSVVVPGSKPRRYTAYYYEAPTDASIERPLSLPAGGTIVDVFPDDCAFSMQDQEGHTHTFNKAEEAISKVLEPGNWSVFPLKCGGIDVFLR